MTPAECAARIRQAAANLSRELRAAEEANLQDALETARRYSSGPYSLAELRRLGHPYSRRRPRPPLPPGIVNVQSGQFRAGWQPEGPDEDSGTLKSRVVNETVHADLVTRNPRTVARPIVAAVEAEIAARVEARRQAALRKAER